MTLSGVNLGQVHMLLVIEHIQHNMMYCNGMITPTTTATTTTTMTIHNSGVTTQTFAMSAASMAMTTTSATTH